MSINLTGQISRRFQEGFQEKSRTCLHCFGLLCNVANLLVCLNIEQKHDMHNMGAVERIKRATSFLNKRSGTSFIMTGNQCSRSSTFYTIISRRTIQIQGDFQEGFLNSRFPGFPGVVDTLISEPVFPANLLTGAKHLSAFSTNHLTDTDKTKHNTNT